MNKTTRTTRAFVDGLEEGVARLLLDEGDRVFTVPAALLPDGAPEGTYLDIVISVAPPPLENDPEKAEDITARRKKLAGSDPGGDIKL